MDMIFCRGMRFTSSLGFSPIFRTKNFLETARFMRCSDTGRWKFKLFERNPHYKNLSCNYVTFLNRIKTYEVPRKFDKNVLVARYCNLNDKGHVPKVEPVQKVSMFAKMKQLTKDYWHVFIPVHLVTSLGWVAAFYVTIKNGVDIVKIMERMKVNQKYIDMMKNSGAGTWALVYLLYKIFTPLRYPVTIGCTTMAIRWLSKSGIVKPLTFQKQSKMAYKVTESNKATTPKTGFKVERQTEPPKT